MKQSKQKMENQETPQEDVEPIVTFVPLKAESVEAYRKLGEKINHENNKKKADNTS